MYNHILRFIGSIKFAVPLLIIIVSVLIGATFYEAQVGSPTVQQMIYKSPWFGGLMFLLAVNLGVSAFSRYPWRGSRKIGFACTHLGLILIIAGSAAVIHLGTEGLILLRTDRDFDNQIRVEGELLEVINKDGKLEQTDLLITPNGSINRQKFAGLSLLDYAENTIKTVNFVEGGTVDNIAVKLNLTSQRMGQTLERWLAVAPVAYSKVTVGIAELEIIEASNEQEFKNLLSVGENQTENPWGILDINSRQLDVKNNISKTLQLKDNIKVKVVDFWNDFGLGENNTPINRSSKFNNPVVQLEVSSQEGVERWFIFSKSAFQPVRTIISGNRIQGLEISYQISEQLPQDFFHIITTKEGKLYYRANSSKGFKSGELEIGKAIEPGWADFKITVEKIVTNAQVNHETIPVSNPKIESSPALLVATKTGIKQWLTWGEPTTIKNANGEEILAAFTPKLLDLPFNIALEDFIVERNEGSASVAMWTSKISLKDTDNNDIIHRQVWMNHPTCYHGWKIAQASWNPGDLKQSTLQIKREPVWVTALTWMGSLVVVLGILIMFYGSAIVQKFNLKSSPNKSSEKTINSENEELVTIP